MTFAANKPIALRCISLSLVKILLGKKQLRISNILHCAGQAKAKHLKTSSPLTREFFALKCASRYDGRPMQAFPPAIQPWLTTHLRRCIFEKKRFHTNATDSLAVINTGIISSSCSRGHRRVVHGEQNLANVCCKQCHRITAYLKLK